MLERSVEHPVVQWAEQRGILHTKLNLMGNRSWPDRVFWLPGGRPVLMEFKRPGAKPRPLQQRTLQHLKRLGYDAHCIDNPTEGIRILQNACASAAFNSTQAAHATARWATATKKGKRKP